MTEPSSNHTYDPNIVIKAADEKLAVNDVAGGQTLFQSALLNWVDDAQFAASSNPNIDADQIREAIATLWIAYAHYLQKAKQFKSATEAYEQAVACPIGEKSGRVWLDYARFLEERGKLRTAQQVYLRALVDNDGGQVQDEQDRNLLWSEFLNMMQTNKPDLTMDALKQAIEEEHLSALTSTQPDGVGSIGASADDEMYDDLPRANKRPRVDGNASIKMESDSEQKEFRTHVVTASDVKTEENALFEIIENPKKDSQFMASWLVRDGDEPPQAPSTALFEPAPPKLSDPTGKDLLGEDLALQLIRRLLEPTGSVILQVCRGLWMMTALKEMESQKTLNEIDETIKEEAKTLQSRLDERLSVAGAAEAAVRAVNETEWQAFQNNCNQQRQQALNEIAWTFRELLWMQQQFLTKLKIPGFNSPTVDDSEVEFQARVCSYLHSAFFLRQRIGEESHTKMLTSQVVRLSKLIEDQKMIIGTSSPVPPGAPSGRTKPSRFSPKPTGTGARLSPMPMGRLSPSPNVARNSPVPEQFQYQHPPPMQQQPIPTSLPMPMFSPQFQQPSMQHFMQQPQQYLPSGVVYPPGQLPLMQPQLQQQQQQQLLQQQQMMMPPNFPYQQQYPTHPYPPHYH